MERANQDKLSLLLIEDDLLDQRAVERMLDRTRMGCTLACAEDLEAGLAELTRVVYDCVLLDWHLPDGRGGEFLEQAVVIAPDVPVIVLTGSDDGSIVKEALSYGAQDYLVKSEFSPGMLERAIRYAIDRKQSEQLRARIVKVERLRSIGQLASGVAHEINNPAGWITANLEFMIETIDGAATPDSSKVILEGETLAELRDLLDECQQGIGRISDIVRALRTYAEASREKIEPVNLNFVVEQAMQLTSSELRWRARVIPDLDPELPNIDGDIGTLVQSLVHILMNAAQSIERVRERREHIIQISTRMIGNQISLLIEDSGVGLDAALVDRAFEPFVASPSYRTGMGLAVVKDVVEQHGGVVRFVRLHEPGARIEILLPCSSEDAKAEDASATETITPDYRGTMRILIIDDEPHMQRMFMRLFGSEHDIQIASTLGESNRLLAEDPSYDGILINLLRFDNVALEWLASVDGLEDRLGERMVVCTAGGVSNKLQEFIAASSATTLEKPFELSDLQSILGHWYTLREARIENLAEETNPSEV